MRMPATILVFWFVAGIVVAPKAAIAEWYAAGTAGVNFADRINSIAGTGASAGVPGPLADFDLSNSMTYGGKLGYFPGHSWVGIEGEVFHTTPHIKSLGDDPGTPSVDPDPGIHLRSISGLVHCHCIWPSRRSTLYLRPGRYVHTHNMDLGELPGDALRPTLPDLDAEQPEGGRPDHDRLPVHCHLGLICAVLLLSPGDRLLS